MKELVDFIIKQSLIRSLSISTSLLWKFRLSDKMYSIKVHWSKFQESSWWSSLQTKHMWGSDTQQLCMKLSIHDARVRVNLIKLRKPDAKLLGPRRFGLRAAACDFWFAIICTVYCQYGINIEPCFVLVMPSVPENFTHPLTLWGLGLQKAV
jgi:hypothetical protein